MATPGMATPGKLRVGIVGASPGRGFASIAHIPALQVLPGVEITAVCTTRQESADAAAKHFGIPLAFADPAKLAEMGRAARAHALTASWDSVFEGVYRAYEGILPAAQAVRNASESAVVKAG